MKGRVVVAGSYVVDLTSRVTTMPIPGQTVLAQDFVMGPGGKGSNQAVAAHRAGADALLLTKVGADAFGDMAKDFYRKEGMDTRLIFTDETLSSGTALIIVDENSGQNMIAVCSGACGHISGDEIDGAAEEIEKASLLLLQLEINLDAVWRAAELAWAADVSVVLNPAPASEVPDDVLAKLYAITPNETEAQALTGVEVTDEETAAQAAAWFFSRGVKNVIVTLGDKGVYANDGQRGELFPRIPVDAVDATGAGDAFNGAFAAALARGEGFFDAVRWGNGAGALSVTRAGTAPAMPHQGEIDELVRRIYGR